jgi:hypothetical protein
MIEATLADEQRVVRDLHANFRRQLKELAVKEERLVDLASDGELPGAYPRPPPPHPD